MKKLTLIYIILSISFLINNVFSQCFAKIELQTNVTVAQKNDNSIWAWGAGYNGQLNNGTNFDEYLPVQYTYGTNWKSITSSSATTFAINQNGTLWGSGGNVFGALGIGSNIVGPYALSQIGTANNWKSVSPSSDFTIALKTNNTLWAWGHNNFNQLGDGTSVDRRVPVQISNATDWKLIKTGITRYSFAIKNNNTLWCWGDNTVNVLGEDSVSSVSNPTQHNPDSDWLTFACGGAHVIAIKTNGTLWGWGNYGYGETGIDLSNPPIPYDSSVPRQIGTDTDWRDLEAGQAFSMGIKTNGTLWAWGRNLEGQLGVGGTTNRFVPVQVGSDTNWASVSCGYQSTVALKTDGTLWAWGNNDYGQLGDGSNVSTLVPTQISVAGCNLGSESFLGNNDGFTIAPNPSNGFTNISIPTNSKNVLVEVYDLVGKKIADYNDFNNSNIWIFKTNSFDAGVYIVVFKTNENIILQKKLIIK